MIMENTFAKMFDERREAAEREMQKQRENISNDQFYVHLANTDLIQSELDALIRLQRIFMIDEPLILLN